MRNLTSFFALSFSLLTVASASAAGPDPAPKAAAEAAAPAKVVGPPEVAWKDLTDEQKGKFMKAVVVPKMKGPFQAFDSVKFEKFNCSTCHGKDAKARKFKMPNPEIHALPPTHEAFNAALKENPTWPKWTKFMGETVVPQMAAILGKPAFNPAKPDPGAFGCVKCHTLAKK